MARKNRSFILIFLVALLLPMTSSAAVVWESELKVVDIGCDIVENTFFVVVDKEVGPSSCKKNKVIWSSDIESGAGSYAIALAAFVSGKTIFLAFDDPEGCYPNNTSYPTFRSLGM